jgi:hypothetical protein
LGQADYDAFLTQKPVMAALMGKGYVPYDNLADIQKTQGTLEAERMQAQKQRLSLQTLVSKQGLRDAFNQSLGTPRNEFLPDLVAGLGPNATPEQKQRAQAVRKKMDTFANNLLEKNINPQSDTITKDSLGQVLSLLGATPEQIAELPDVMSRSMAEKLTTQFGQTERAVLNRKSIEKNKKEDRAARKAENDEARKFQERWSKEMQAIKTEDKIRVQTIATEQDLLVKGADASNKVALENLQAKNRLETTLAEIELRAKNTAEEQAIDIAAQNYRATMKGTQQLDRDYFNHLLDLSESGSSTESGRKSLFERLVEDSVKAQPGLAPALVGALEQNDQLSPGERRSAQSVIAKTINGFKRQQEAAGRIVEILQGGNKRLGQDYDNPFKQIQAFEAELINPASNADKDMIRKEMGRLQDLRIQRTQEIPAATQEDVAQYVVMEGAIRRMRRTYTPEVIGPLNAMLAKGQIITANALRSVGLETFANFIDKDPAAKLFIAESEMFRKTVSSLTGGLNLTEFEIEMVKQTQPVISNPNFLNALDIFELNIKDLKDARTAKNLGNPVEMEKLTKRAVARSDAFLRQRGIPSGDKTAKPKEWPSRQEAEAEFNRLITEEQLTPKEAYERMQ